MGQNLSLFRLVELTETHSWSLSKGKIGELRSAVYVFFRKALWVECFWFRVVLRVMMNGVHRNIDSSLPRYRDPAVITRNRNVVIVDTHPIQVWDDRILPQRLCNADNCSLVMALLYVVLQCNLKQLSILTKYHLFEI
jgi:hypothetical protein